MNKKTEKILTLLVDFLTINTAFFLFYCFRVETGWFDMLSRPEYYAPMFALYVFWMLIFSFYGMYRPLYAISRFDELLSLLKCTFLGICLMFALILYDDYVHNQPSSTRFIIFIYWIILYFLTGFGRLFLRSLQQKLIINGVGRKNAIMVGYNQKAFEMHEAIIKYRPLGIDVVAYVALNKENLGLEHLGVYASESVENLSEAIDKFNAKEVILALEKQDDDLMLRVITECDEKNTGIKIVPDLCGIVSGQARTTQIYGFPLIDIVPQLMPQWEKSAKRMLDIFCALILLILSGPVIIFTAIAIKIDSPGSVFYRQQRVGLNGRLFKILKFRSMRQDAEKNTGPMWSTKNDPRITRVGRFIRKVRIDEIPQMYNVLKGEMSLVGPRPERQFFVDKLAKEVPLYKRRLKVKPGVTGWAQVKCKYDESIEDVKNKVKYDLFYIENQSLRMDAKILLRTVYVVTFGKGHYE